jgi:hypothetical protein
MVCPLAVHADGAEHKQDIQSHCLMHACRDGGAADKQSRRTAKLDFDHWCTHVLCMLMECVYTE